mgnify:CR=1 FL=1
MNVRKLISYVTILLVSFLAGTGLTSCQKEVEGVTEIIFTNVPSGKLNLAVGDEFKVKYLVLPETMQETAEIEWTTSDKNVARIRRGNIQAEGPGKAIITATSGNATASISVTVNAVQVESLDFPDEPFEVYLGATVKVTFENVTPENASLTTVDWEVKDYGEGDATVEADDDCIYITGTEVGVADLYGYIDGVEIDHQEIVIKERIPVTSVSVTLSKPSVTFGESLTVSTDVQPSNASLKDVAITCTPSNLATVSGNTITAGKKGKTIDYNESYYKMKKYGSLSLLTNTFATLPQLIVIVMKMMIYLHQYTLSWKKIMMFVSTEMTVYTEDLCLSKKILPRLNMVKLLLMSITSDTLWEHMM